jgi:ketosteroid isomerase-like protein
MRVMKTFQKFPMRSIIWVGITIIMLATTGVGVTWGAKEEMKGDIAAVNAVIDAFQKCYSNKDIKGVRELFYAEAVIAWDVDQGSKTQVVSGEEWLQFSEKEVFTKSEPISDILTDRDITVHRNIAYAVYNYKYTDSQEQYVGIDVITLLKMRGRWRILSLQWTGDPVTR